MVDLQREPSGREFEHEEKKRRPWYPSGKGNDFGEGMIRKGRGKEKFVRDGVREKEEHQGKAIRGERLVQSR